MSGSSLGTMLVGDTTVELIMSTAKHWTSAVVSESVWALNFGSDSTRNLFVSAKIKTNFETKESKCH